ncbi:hypothetical protein JTE90_002837 [Oedothorax gibbosus]|uniref:G-patch domain-containing protein n=1 Tax=Oedothorax gibbosus TaxID=931172 RepID=A0AAV6UIU0_9ARAC|nr:hypothetical protein JTE90_002837 [Oedothorax gibbosus]
MRLLLKLGWDPTLGAKLGSFMRCEMGANRRNKRKRHLEEVNRGCCLFWVQTNLSCRRFDSTCHLLSSHSAVTHGKRVARRKGAHMSDPHAQMGAAQLREYSQLPINPEELYCLQIGHDPRYKAIQRTLSVPPGYLSWNFGGKRTAPTQDKDLVGGFFYDIS